MFIFSTKQFNPQRFTGAEFREYELLKRVERAQFEVTLRQRYSDRLYSFELSLLRWWTRELKKAIRAVLWYNPKTSGLGLCGRCDFELSCEMCYRLGLDSDVYGCEVDHLPIRQLAGGNLVK